MFKQTDPPQATEEEIHQALVECIKIAARRGRQLRLERERAERQSAEPQAISQEVESSVAEMSHEEFLMWAAEQSRFLERIRTFLENLKEIEKIDEIIRDCDWVKRVEEGKKILAQLENHTNQTRGT